MNSNEFEKMYKSICVEKPGKKSINAFIKHRDRQSVIEFLLSKLQHFILDENYFVDNNEEWGIIYCVKLLGDLKTVESIDKLVTVMDMVKDDPLSFLYSNTINALAAMGKSAFNPVYEKYLEDKEDSELSFMWLEILVESGVKDSRIKEALVDHCKINRVGACHLIGDYGDKSLLPMLKECVLLSAEILNENKINPFKPGIRFKVPEAGIYIDAREDWVLLETGLPVLSEKFGKKVEELDNKLLKYSDKSEKRELGENDNQLFIDIEKIRMLEISIELSFSELRIQSAFGNTAAIILGGLCYPENLSMDIMFPKIYKKEVIFESEEQMQDLIQSIMDLWNYLVASENPSAFDFLLYTGDIKIYIQKRINEIKGFLDLILFKSYSDIFLYTKESQNEIKAIQKECENLSEILSSPKLCESADPESIEKQVYKIWLNMFHIKELETLNRQKLITEGKYQPRIIKHKIGRNEPCPCGSGKKFKYCCIT